MRGTGLESRDEPDRAGMAREVGLGGGEGGWEVGLAGAEAPWGVGLGRGEGGWEVGA